MNHGRHAAEIKMSHNPTEVCTITQVLQRSKWVLKEGAGNKTNNEQSRLHENKYGMSWKRVLVYNLNAHLAKAWLSSTTTLLQDMLLCK